MSVRTNKILKGKEVSNGRKTCDSTSFYTAFKSNKDDRRVVMKSSVGPNKIR